MAFKSPITLLLAEVVNKNVFTRTPTYIVFTYPTAEYIQVERAVSLLPHIL